jgi:flavin reductase (DIM6/NTAB) family NADH-FMN oxidoreductase RutF
MQKTKIESGKGPMPILGACPIVIVGAHIDGKPDFATLAWTGVAASVPPHISIALQHHRYSLKGIRQNMTFSVNIPSIDQVKETDYCGLVSGANVDKVKDCHFKVFYGELKSAPFIEQCPINHACEVVQILNLGSHELIIGKIIETHVSTECLTDGRPDARKINPLMYVGRSYCSVGQDLGGAFEVGKSVNPEAQMDSLKELQRMRNKPETR